MISALKRNKANQVSSRSVTPCFERGVHNYQKQCWKGVDLLAQTPILEVGRKHCLDIIYLNGPPSVGREEARGESLAIL